MSKLVYFKQFSFAQVHRLFRPLDRTLSGATTPGQWPNDYACEHLPFCREAFGVFYSPNWLGKSWKGIFGVKENTHTHTHTHIYIALLLSLSLSLYIYIYIYVRARACVCVYTEPPRHDQDIMLNLFLKVVYLVWYYLPNPSARAGYDTRSIFKRTLTGLNSEFSFS